MDKKRIFLLRLMYWLGAIFDGIVVIPMLAPSVGGALFGIPNFHPPVEYHYAMYLAAALMAGWTVLLLWAERRPVERSGILIITLFPVLTGLIAAGIYAVVSGMVQLDKMLPTFLMQGALFIFDVVVLVLTRNL